MSDECKCICKFDECIIPGIRWGIIECLQHKKQIKCNIKTSIKIAIENCNIPIRHTMNGMYCLISIPVEYWILLHDYYGFIGKLLIEEEKQQKLLEYNKKLKSDIQDIKHKIDLLNT